MPAKNPRVHLTLQPDVYNTFKGLADIQHRPVSALITELLVLVHPVQQKVLNVSRRLNRLNTESRSGFVDSLDKAQVQIEDIFAPLLVALDGIEAQSQPPHSNTGVTNSSDTPQNPANPHSRAFSTEHPLRSGKVAKGTLQ